MRNPVSLLSGALVVASALGAQSLDPITTTPEDGGIVQGVLPGTQSWVAHFGTRSFDLERFRDAIYTGQPAAAVDTIVADMERQVQLDQAAFVAAIQRLGGRVVRQYWIVNAANFEIDPAQLPAVAALDNVVRLEADRWTSPVIKVATNASNHNSDGVNAGGNEGLNVATAIMDTGQDSNMGGIGRPHRLYYINGDPTNTGGGGLNGSRLVVNRQIGTVGADDVHGHGTGVASIVASGGWLNAGADKGHAPRAKIAGYAISNNSGGGSTTAVMAAAWQSIAADKATFNTVSANNSYSGSPNPLDVGQQALDACALNADVLICCAAANSGSSTSVSQSTANGLAVAAVNANSHTVASFSSRGPLSGDTARFYPDISACGVSTVMGLRDNEAGNYTGSGTSMASPQVCGGATLVRNANGALRADETKAILLASARDISAQNPTAPYNSRNAYGMGLLRDDDAVVLAVDPQRHGRFCLDTGYTVYRRNMAVANGQLYQVAITWMRTVMTNTAWSNLNLEIYNGTTLVASSMTTRNLYEMCRWTSAFTGTVEIRVTAAAFGAGLSSQWFAWASSHDTSSGRPSTFTNYGIGCRGAISATGLPDIDSSFNVDLRGALGSTPAVLLAGASNRTWAGIPLPFDLAPLNARGCWINASGDAQISRTTSSLGTASVALRLPKLTSLIGVRVYFQWFHFDRGANGLGLVSTQGAAATVGHQ